MTTSITAGVHVDRAELHHCVLDTGAGMITLGAQHGWPRVDVFFRSTAEIHALIAELVALEQEMDPPAVSDGEPWTRAGVAAAIVPAPSVPNPPHHILPSEQPCTAPGYDDRGVNGSGYMCTAQDGHDGPDHIAYMPGGGEYHRWPVAEPAPSGMQDPAPVARVITDSERTCPEQHPGSGAPCYRSGDHGVHRDPDGETWRTDGAERFISGSPFCTDRDFTGTLCELPLGHDGNHRAPGDDEGDDDITWSDLPASVTR